jgi:hypothetical protein
VGRFIYTLGLELLELFCFEEKTVKLWARHSVSEGIQLVSRTADQIYQPQSFS